MPHVIHEFNWVIHPILVLGANTQSVKKFFEDASFELTTDLSSGVELGLRSFAVPGPGALSFWMSASLGKRGKGSSRVSFLGVSLEGEISELLRLLHLVDGVILLAEKEDPNFEKIFRQKSTVDLGDKPWIFVGPGIEGTSLQLKALEAYLKEKLDRVLYNPRREQLLADSLSWILEESA